MGDDIQIRTLHRVSAADLIRLGGNYSSHTRYEVAWSERRDRIAFTLRPVPLRAPFRKVFHYPAAELRRYGKVVRLGWSLGAYDGAKLVGLALAEPRPWNRSLWVWEIGVAASHRRRGIGTCLVQELERSAKGAGYRALVCETQTTNAPAMEFYWNTGFKLEGVDVSYYSNEDLRRGEVAIFMKKRVALAKAIVSDTPRGRRRTSK
jgi:ribosomal protein S18 acetylase RimI-like enzyme